MHTTCDIFQQRVNEAFSMYCDDEDTGKKVVFNKDHMEGMIWHSDADFPFIVLFFMWHIQGGIIVVSSNFFAVFEEAFSMFDVNASGKIQFKFFFSTSPKSGLQHSPGRGLGLLEWTGISRWVTRNSYFVNNSKKIWFGTKLYPIFLLF